MGSEWLDILIGGRSERNSRHRSYFGRLKEAFLEHNIKGFSQGRDGVLYYQGRLCVPSVVDLG